MHLTWSGGGDQDKIFSPSECPADVHCEVKPFRPFMYFPFSTVYSRLIDGTTAILPKP